MTTKKYHICSMISGADMGIFEADSAADAIRALYAEAGSDEPDEITSFGDRHATTTDGIDAREVE